MAWTTPKTAGIVIGILFLTALLTTIILIYRSRARNTRLKLDSESAATSPEPEPERTYAVPSPTYESGTVRRTTGQPQSFYDWVQSSNAQAAHERMPLKNGPGPAAASSMYSQSTISRANTMVRPATRDSVGASSLRKAVLGAGEVKSVQTDKKEPVLKNGEFKAEEPKAKTEVQTATKARGYSGAWP